MKLVTLAIIMTLLLIATGCNKAKAQTPQEQFQTKTDAQIGEMQKKIDEFKTKSTEKLNEQMTRLEEKKKEAKKELDELKAATITGADLDKAKTKISGTMEDLEKSYESVKAVEIQNAGLWNKIVDNLGLILISVLAVAIFAAIAYGLYRHGGTFLNALKDTEAARGLITFLVTFTTVAVALLLVINASGPGNINEVKERFGLGMQILTALIGVLGTILGFYFGTAKTAVSQAIQPEVAKPDDAKSLVKKAEEFYKLNGKDKALAEFNNPKGQFVKDGSFIYALDLTGKIIAHPKAESVGKDFSQEKDAEGKTFGADILKAATEKGSGWADYKWINPDTKNVEPKTVYCEKVDDVIICSEAQKK